VEGALEEVLSQSRFGKSLHKDEDDHRDYQEVEQRSDEVAYAELYGPQVQNRLTPASPRDEEGHHGHQDIRDERGDEVPSCSTYDEADGETDDAVLVQKLEELLSESLGRWTRRSRLGLNCCSSSNIFS